MNALFLPLIAHVSSLLLVLPAGWCNSLASAPAEAAPAKATCCHQAPQEKPAESHETPAQPSARCCCDWDATLPEKSLLPDDVSSLALFTLADLSLSFAAVPGRGNVLKAPYSLGPPLHVLQCVWLC